MMQVALQKERREMKQEERDRQLAEVAETNERMGKDWLDPVGEFSALHCRVTLFSTSLFSVLSAARKAESHSASAGPSAPFRDVPEWKKHVTGGSRYVGAGQKIVKSILEQRQSLPIYSLKDELLKAIHENQILVVIGETGAWRLLFESHVNFAIF